MAPTRNKQMNATLCLDIQQTFALG